MNIVICVDHRFVMQCGVLSYSICVNNKDVDIHFFIMTDNTFTLEDKKDITDIVKTYNNENIVDFVLVDDKYVKDFAWYEQGYYTIQTFYRIFMPILLSSTIDKVLYLDGDIVVRDSLKKLWNLSMDNYAIAATPDGGTCGSFDIYNRLKYSIDLGYFNAGVMLVNLKYWRDNDLSKKMIEFLYNNRNCLLGDQDALNFVLKECKLHLPMMYNVQPPFLFDYRNMRFSIYQYKEELDEARRNPVVLHFAGCRPWEKGCDHPYKDEFFKYQSKTKWKDAPLIKVNRSCSYYVKEFLRKILTPFGICHYVTDYFDRNLHLVK